MTRHGGELSDVIVQLPEDVCGEPFDVVADGTKAIGCDIASSPADVDGKDAFLIDGDNEVASTKIQVDKDWTCATVTEKLGPGLMSQEAFYRRWKAALASTVKNQCGPTSPAAWEITFETLTPEETMEGTTVFSGTVGTSFADMTPGPNDTVREFKIAFSDGDSIDESALRAVLDATFAAGSDPADSLIDGANDSCDSGAAYQLSQASGSGLELVARPC